MAHRKNSKDFYAEVNSSVSDAVKEQCKKRGQIKNDVTTAALRVWMALPRDIQGELIEEPPANVYKFLVERMLDAATLGYLRSLSPEGRQFVVATVREASRKVSRKK
ncbi:MAG: hypothetical protein ACYSUV_12775 [Planctomycetota bacterium]|jgi:hypothetical protein